MKSVNNINYQVILSHNKNFTHYYRFCFYSVVFKVHILPLSIRVLWIRPLHLQWLLYNGQINTTRTLTNANKRQKNSTRNTNFYNGHNYKYGT